MMTQQAFPHSSIMPQGDQLEEVAVTAQRLPTWNPGPEAPVQDPIVWFLQQLGRAIRDPCDPGVQCMAVLPMTASGAVAESAIAESAAAEIQTPYALEAQSASAEAQAAGTPRLG
jgi:hypothetical protein